MPDVRSLRDANFKGLFSVRARLVVLALIMVSALMICAFAPAAASTGYPPVIVIGPGGPPAPAPGSGSVFIGP